MDKNIRHFKKKFKDDGKVYMLSMDGANFNKFKYLIEQKKKQVIKSRERQRSILNIKSTRINELEEKDKDYIIYELLEIKDK